MGYMSIATLAEYLDISRNTAMRLVERGILPQPITIGTMKRWDEEAVKKSIGSALESSARGISQAADPDSALNNWSPTNGRKNRKA